MLPATANREDYYESGFPKKIIRNKYDMVINKRLKEARTKKGFSLAKAVRELEARGIKTGVSTIQGYEAEEDNANHRYPSLNMLLALANLYDCSMDFVFGLSDEVSRPSKDIAFQIENNQTVLWQGKEITSGQKAILTEKANEIMAL
jgi:transcriptional regulator with XRE-family HTH domain